MPSEEAIDLAARLHKTAEAVDLVKGLDEELVPRGAALKARVAALPEDAPNMDLLADVAEWAADCYDFALSQHGNLTGGEVRTYEAVAPTHKAVAKAIMLEVQCNDFGTTNPKTGDFRCTAPQIELLEKVCNAAATRILALLPQQPNPVLGSKTEGEVE